MPLDDRLRRGLHAEAAHIAPDVEQQLDVVVRRGDRRHSAAAVQLAAAAVGVLAIAVLVRGGPFDPFAAVMSVLTTSPIDAPSVTPGPRGGSEALVGSYRATLAPSDQTVASLGMAGDWQLDLAADSTIVIVPPGGFATRSGEALTGYLYAVRDGQLFTNLFARHLERSCVGHGAYRWRLAEGELTLERLDDPCAPRVALLASGPWRRLGD